MGQKEEGPRLHVRHDVGEPTALAQHPRDSQTQSALSEVGGGGVRELKFRGPTDPLRLAAGWRPLSGTAVPHLGVSMVTPAWSLGDNHSRGHMVGAEPGLRCSQRTLAG